MSLNMQEVKDARNAHRWMAIGVMPSQEVARAAREVVREAMADEALCDVDVDAAQRASGAMAMGVAPSRDLSSAAALQMQELLERVADGETSMLRSSMRQRG